MVALELGYAAGADACEIDVQFSRDGQVVVIHDESLERTTDVARRFAGDSRGTEGFLVRDFDLDEIRTLDAGSWFVSAHSSHRNAAHFGTLDRINPQRLQVYQSGGIRIPTLLEVLKRVRALNWLVNVEIKVDENTSGSALLDRVLGEILETETDERVLISSFDPAIVAEASRRQRTATGFLTETAIPEPRRYVRDVLHADFYHLSVQALGASTHPGVPVFVYTVNDAAEGGKADHLISWPVDGVFTDDPAALLARFDVLRTN